MENYKIKVNNEAESKEAQELFFELGYDWFFGNSEFSNCSSKLLTANSDGLLAAIEDDRFSYQELTLHQLRDLVVLHRNDVSDATHTDKREEKIYLTADKVIYYWQGEWCKSAINNSNDYEAYIANSLTPIKQPEQGLISGVDALRALAEKKNVQCSIAGKNDWTVDILTITPYYFIGMGSGQFQFRLKPSTIKIELEIPAPFEPKDGEKYFFIDPVNSNVGYSSDWYEEKNKHACQIQFGAWRKESEVQAVVAALQGAIKCQ